MATINEWDSPDVTCSPMEAGEISNCDLQAEMAVLDAAGTPYECFSLITWKDSETREAEEGEMVLVPSAQRAGVSWGAPGTWIDAASADQALEMIRAGLA